MGIGLIALDLDGTTLSGDKSLSSKNLHAITGAIASGMEIVPVTGRGFDSLPECVTSIEGIRYYINSNGANIYDASIGGRIYESFVDAAAVEELMREVKERGYMFESFVGGYAYIGRDWYDDMKENGCDYRGVEYALKTRTPVDDLFAFTLENKERIENINVFFPTKEEKESFFPILSGIKNAEITSSYWSNYEMGPLGASKGAALRFLMDRLGLGKEEVMAIGDSPNDISMLNEAGVAVAVENAEPHVKAAADIIVSPNDEDGVAEAIEPYII